MAPEGELPTAAAKDDYFFTRDSLDVNRYLAVYSSSGQNVARV